ncbi:MAG: NAD(P)H-dependent oxidoreductase, partial [bacterium]
MSKQFLALVGSPRPKSTSENFASYLVEGFTAKGWQAQTLVVCEAIRQPAKWPALEEAFRTADAIAIVTPLYVDSIPAELIDAFERLVATRAAKPGQLFAVLNCGFAEAVHNDTALDICRLFSQAAGFEWAGGLAIGSGGMFSGSSLKELGGRALHITSAFDQTVAAIDAGQQIPDTARTGIRKQVIPKWAYMTMGNLGMILGANKYGNLWKIGAK